MTTRARRVIRAAGKIAQESGNQYVWLEHVLYAITNIIDPVKDALEEAGITTMVVYSHLPKAHHRKVRRVGFHPRIIILIPNIYRAMLFMDNVQVQPGHIVLAMIQTKNKLIIDLCMEVKISLIDLEKKVVQAMKDDIDSSLLALLRDTDTDSK